MRRRVAACDGGLRLAILVAACLALPTSSLAAPPSPQAACNLIQGPFRINSTVGTGEAPFDDQGFASGKPITALRWLAWSTNNQISAIKLLQFQYGYDWATTSENNSTWPSGPYFSSDISAGRTRFDSDGRGTLVLSPGDYITNATIVLATAIAPWSSPFRYEDRVFKIHMTTASGATHTIGTSAGPLDLRQVLDATPPACASAPRGFRLAYVKGTNAPPTESKGLTGLTFVWEPVGPAPPPSPPPTPSPPSPPATSPTCQSLQQGPFGQPARNSFTGGAEWQPQNYTITGRSSFDDGGAMARGVVTGIRIAREAVDANLKVTESIQVRYGSTWAAPVGLQAGPYWWKEVVVPTAIASLSVMQSPVSKFSGPGVRALRINGQVLGDAYSESLFGGSSLSPDDSATVTDALPCLTSAFGFQLTQVKGVIATAKSSSVATITFVESLTFVWKAAPPPPPPSPPPSPRPPSPQPPPACARLEQGPFRPNATADTSGETPFSLLPGDGSQPITALRWAYPVGYGISVLHKLQLQFGGDWAPSAGSDPDPWGGSYSGDKINEGSTSHDYTARGGFTLAPGDYISGASVLVGAKPNQFSPGTTGGVFTIFLTTAQGRSGTVGTPNDFPVASQTFNATPCGASPRGYRLVGIKGTEWGLIASISFVWEPVGPASPPSPPQPRSPPPSPPSPPSPSPSCRSLQQGPFGEPAGTSFTWGGQSFTVTGRTPFDDAAFTARGPITGIRLRNTYGASEPLPAVTTVQFRYGSTWAPVQGEAAYNSWAKEITVPTSGAFSDNLTAVWGSGSHSGPGLRGLAVGDTILSDAYASFVYSGGNSIADPSVKWASALPCINSTRGLQLAQVKGVIATARSASGAVVTFVESLSFVWRPTPAPPQSPRPPSPPQPSPRPPSPPKPPSPPSPPSPPPACLRLEQGPFRLNSSAQPGEASFTLMPSAASQPITALRWAAGSVSSYRATIISKLQIQYDWDWGTEAGYGNWDTIRSDEGDWDNTVRGGFTLAPGDYINSAVVQLGSRNRIYGTGTAEGVFGIIFTSASGRQLRVGADLPFNLVSNRTYNAAPCGSSPRGYRLVGLKGATSNTSDGGLYSVSLAWAAVDATPPPTPPSSCRVLEQGPFGEPATSSFTWMGRTLTIVSRSNFDGSAFTWNGPVTGIRLRHSLFTSTLPRVTTVQVRYGSTWAPPQGELATDGWAKDLMVPTSSAITNLTAYWGSGTYFGPGLRGLAMGAQRVTMPYANYLTPGDVDQADAVRSAETLPCLDSARGFELASVKGVIVTARSGSEPPLMFVESLSFVWRAT